MATIERILPTGQSETEFWNEKRIQAGYTPFASTKVTKIRPGVQCACGAACHVKDVGKGWFSEQHEKGCSITNMAGKLELVGDGTGQACARLRDFDGAIVQGILVLNGLLPYELPKTQGSF